MKKLIVFFIAFTLLSCNDGDFDVPEFEFEETVKTCGEYIIYRTNTEGTEVIILNLNPSNLDTDEGDKDVKLSSSVTIHYRIFDDAISDNYFCQNIPPATPILLKELIAESGTLHITTTAIKSSTDEITGYKYSITISDLLFNDIKERIFFESFDFGELEINL